MSCEHRPMTIIKKTTNIISLNEIWDCLLKDWDTGHYYLSRIEKKVWENRATIVEKSSSDLCNR